MAAKNRTTEAIGAKLANRSCLAAPCRFHHLRHQEMGCIVLMTLLTFFDFIALSLGYYPSSKFHNAK